MNADNHHSMATGNEMLITYSVFSVCYSKDKTLPNESGYGEYADLGTVKKSKTYYTLFQKSIFLQKL